MMAGNDATQRKACARPAVVAVGYNRPEALLRLLESLRAGAYPPGVPLVISLDWSGDAAPAAVAEAFEWPHGPKRVIRHPQQLGLREHILACGDLTQEFGGIILFEDDIVAAPHHYAYVQAAFDFYGDEPAIGGVALYSYRLNEFNNLDFEALDDGSDVYFLQVAASWGQAWTASQWSAFRAWYGRHSGDPIRVEDRLPRQLEAWRANSWKRFYIKYLTATGRTFVFPRPSLSTNMAIAGTNTKRLVSIYQSPLDLLPRRWRFRSLANSLAQYDVFYEPLPSTLRALQPRLADADFDVDLFGTKPRQALSRPDLLSSRPTGAARQGFGLLTGAPPAASIAQAQPGDFFSLARRDTFGAMTRRRLYTLARASQVGSAFNKVMFQTLKPLQTELLIRKARARDKALASG